MRKRVRTYAEWVADLLTIPPEQREDWIFDSLRDKEMLHIFGRYFFPHIIRGDEDVPECHIDLTLEMGRRENGAIIFPRGFAKSTWIKIDTIHDIVYALEPVILYIGNTMNDAMLHFQAIKTELESNVLLERVYGNLVPDLTEDSRKWTNKHFCTTNKVHLVARGAGKGRGVNIDNQRPTKIICDDIEDDEQIRSVDRCVKLAHWLNFVIEPSLDPERGFIKMIGTVLAKHCQVLKYYDKHGGIFRKAIENGRSIWQYMWPLERLEKKKEDIGSRAFSQEYMNNPIDDESAIIKPHWILEHMYDRIKDPKALQIVIMMDPQSGESKGADFYAICAVGYYKGDEHRYVLELKKGRGSKLAQAAELIKMFQKYGRKRCWAVGVENVLTQNAVYQNALAWHHGQISLEQFGVDELDRNLPLVKCEPKGKDKVARLEAHEAAFERGEVHLHISMGNFADNISGFPNVEHDDDVDAMIYALDWSNKSNALNKTRENDRTRTRAANIATVGNIESQRF